MGEQQPFMPFSTEPDPERPSRRWRLLDWFGRHAHVPFLERLKLPKTEESEALDEEDEEGEALGPGRRFLTALHSKFRRQVIVKPVSTTDQPKEPLQHKAVEGRVGETNAEISEDTPLPSTEAVLDVSPTEEAAESYSQSDDETVSQGARRAAAAFMAPVKKERHQEAPSEEALANPDVSNTQPDPVRARPMEPPPDVPPPLETSFEPVQTLQTTTQEVYINNGADLGPAVAAFAGAELLSRGRDKALNKKIEKVEKATQQLKTEQKTQQSVPAPTQEIVVPLHAKEPLPVKPVQQVTPAREQMPAFQTSGSIEEIRPQIKNNYVAPPAAPVEQPVTQQKTAEVKLAPVPEFQSPPAEELRAEQPRLETERYATTPEAPAARNPEARETYFERPYEAKETQMRTQPVGGDALTAPGTSATLPPVMQTTGQVSVSVPDNYQSTSTPTTTQPDSRLYKKAISSGFWTAIVLSAALLIIYILR